MEPSNGYIAERVQETKAFLHTIHFGDAYERNSYIISSRVFITVGDSKPKFSR
jgi:hypothetical protein